MENKNKKIKYKESFEKSISTIAESAIVDVLSYNINSTALKTNSINKQYTIFEIADWFLKKEAMNHLKLQKLCYYSYAWFAALTNRNIFIDTIFEAWEEGPISPQLFNKYKAFYWEVIMIDKEIVLIINKEDEDLLECVWDTYGDQTGNALEALSHSEKPWIEAKNKASKNVLDINIVKEYYRSIYIGEL